MMIHDWPVGELLIGVWFDVADSTWVLVSSTGRCLLVLVFWMSHDETGDVGLSMEVDSASKERIS